MKSVAALQREIADLRRRVGVARKTVQITQLSTWTFATDIGNVRQEINTARNLGYAVEVRCGNGKGELILTAVKRTDA